MQLVTHLSVPKYYWRWQKEQDEAPVTKKLEFCEELDI